MSDGLSSICVLSPGCLSENVERLQKDVLVKRITGKLSDDDAAALRKAEEERAKPALGAVGAWLRGVRLVTEGRNGREDGPEDQDEGGRRPE